MLTIEQTGFINNSANLFGGAIFGTSTSVAVQNCAFTNNSAGEVLACRDVYPADLSACWCMLCNLYRSAPGVGPVLVSGLTTSTESRELVSGLMPSWQTAGQITVDEFTCTCIGGRRLLLALYGQNQTALAHPCAVPLCHPCFDHHARSATSCLADTCIGIDLPILPTWEEEEEEGCPSAIP